MNKNIQSQIDNNKKNPSIFHIGRVFVGYREMKTADGANGSVNCFSQLEGNSQCIFKIFLNYLTFDSSRNDHRSRFLTTRMLVFFFI